MGVLIRDTKDMNTGGDHVRAQGEGTPLQATERGLKRTNPARTLILYFIFQN